MDGNHVGSGIQAKERLIFALDVSTAAAAEALLDRVHSSVGVVKIGLELFAREGPAIIRLAQNRGKPVFLDLKFLDIDETVQRTTASVADLGVSFITVHAHRKTMAAAVRGRAVNPEMKILGVTVLTSFDRSDLEEWGSTWSVERLVAARARMASQSGCDGVIASGQESRTIRSTIPFPFLIVTPGVRPTGAGVDDHARATTPYQAIESGADYVVVGRPIRDAPDPRAAAHAITDEMQAAFEQRLQRGT